jgi:hypothetical protein
MMDDKTGWGCLIAFLGGGIGLCLVAAGVVGWLGAITYEHYGEAGRYLGLAFGGGTIGLIVFIVGMAKAFSSGKEKNSSSDSPEKRPLEENLCPNCLRRAVDGSKTCEWCGADLK